MQSVDVNFYPNLVEIRADLDPIITVRARIVFQRTIKIYPGVDNPIQFQFKNSDQKPVNVDGWDISFNMISADSGVLVLQKPISVIGNAVNGLTSVTVTSYDLLNLDEEFYNFGVTLTDPNTGSEQVVYTDDNYWARGEIQILEGPYPKLKPSVDVLIPFNSNAFVNSSWVTSDAPNLQGTTHHTAEFYFENFTGNIAVQTTLDSLPPIGNTSVSWGTIATLPYVNQNTPDYYDFDGVFTAVRFVCTPNDASQSYMTGGNVAPYADSVTKILYRG